MEIKLLKVGRRRKRIWKKDCTGGYGYTRTNNGKMRRLFKMKLSFIGVKHENVNVTM